MRRLAILPIALLLALSTVAPVAATSGPTYTATINGAGLTGTVTVAVDAAHQTGTLTWQLSGLSTTLPVSVAVYGGSCAQHDGGIAFVTSRGSWTGGTGTRTVDLPAISARWFWFDWDHRGGATATITDGNATTCAAFAQTSGSSSTGGVGTTNTGTSGPTYTATINGAGLTGSVTVSLDAAGQSGTLTWQLSGLSTTSPVTVDVDGGPCSVDSYGIVLVTSTGTWTGGPPRTVVAAPAASGAWVSLPPGPPARRPHTPAGAPPPPPPPPPPPAPLGRARGRPPPGGARGRGAPGRGTWPFGVMRPSFSGTCAGSSVTRPPRRILSRSPSCVCTRRRPPVVRPSMSVPGSFASPGTWP